MLDTAMSTELAHDSDPAKVLSGLNNALSGNFKQNLLTPANIFVDTQMRTMRSVDVSPPTVDQGRMHDLQSAACGCK
jgi:hypothetical protein